jgi:uncharacterized protein (DUF1786 family)
VKILAIDIGTGTQDILLFDTTTQVENCFQMVMPSPTLLVAQRIRKAAERGEDVLLTGTIMGGGPSAWAANDHLKAGLRVHATKSAAKSFNDDLSKVEASGVGLVGDEQAAGMTNVCRVDMRDVDMDAIARAFYSFGLDLQFDALAVAVFDHGNAPTNMSDRRFRFEFLAERLGILRSPAALAFMRQEIPPRLTRMRAVADSVHLHSDLPFLLMDTAPAAILGALEDDRVRAHRSSIIANVGNFHTLAFRFGEGAITGVFEHHTGELTSRQLDRLLTQLADGSLTDEEVFNSQGHGALMLDTKSQPLEFLSVVGPRRGLLANSRHRPYFAAPYGNMMLAGCYGLVRAFARLNPDSSKEVNLSLDAARVIA